MDYFQSNRGLHQGDQFLLFIHSGYRNLARRLNILILDRNLKFHPKCMRINLAHLMLADDLLIFAKASEGFISSIMKAFDDFFELSGFSKNCACLEFLQVIKPRLLSWQAILLENYLVITWVLLLIPRIWASIA